MDNVGGVAFQNTVQQFEVRRLEPPIGLPKLNETQYQAVEKALDKNFTVIQGPPGKRNKYIF